MLYALYLTCRPTIPEQCRKDMQNMISLHLSSSKSQRMAILWIVNFNYSIFLNAKRVKSCLENVVSCFQVFYTFFKVEVLKTFFLNLAKMLITSFKYNLSWPVSNPHNSHPVVSFPIPYNLRYFFLL